MTPPAATAAGTRVDKQTAPRTTRKAPRAPRRVSGPLRPGAHGRAARVTTAPRPRGRGTRPAVRRRGPTPQARAVALVRSLPDHRLIDRLVRGRSWIPLIGVMLAGIVAMQVELLKLNTSIGRSISLSSALQSRNDLLRASISALSDSQRIERLATRLGMVMPGPTSILFLDAGHTSAAKAAASIHAPDGASFESSLAASAAAAQAQSNGTATDATPTASGTSTGATSTGLAPSTPGAPGSASSTLGTTASAPAASGPSANVGPSQTAAPATTGLTGSAGTQSAGTAGSNTQTLSAGAPTVAATPSVGATAAGGQSPTGSP